MRLRASGPTSALAEGIHSLCSEDAGGSCTGGSWTVVLVQLEVEVESSDGSEVPMAEVLSARTDDDSPLTVSLVGSDVSGFGAGVFWGLVAT